MNQATIDYYGLQLWNPDLFKDMVIPEQLDRQLLIDKIIFDTLELEVLYNDPQFAQKAIEMWSQTRLHVWNELAKTMEYEYDPISNYDRKEHWTETETRDLKNSVTRNANEETTGQRKQDDTTHNSSTQNEGSTSEDLVQGFNDSGYVGKQKNEYSGNGSASTDGTIGSEMSESGTRENNSSENGTDTGTVGHEHDLRAYGNIGVTTTQQMIEEQRNVVMFNLYEIITEEFMQKFCILVY